MDSSSTACSRWPTCTKVRQGADRRISCGVLRRAATDVGDGPLLGNLAELISSKQLVHKMTKAPKFKMQRMENLNIVIKFFEVRALRWNRVKHELD